MEYFTLDNFLSLFVGLLLVLFSPFILFVCLLGAALLGIALLGELVRVRILNYIKTKTKKEEL